MTRICKQRYFSNPFATSALEEGECKVGQRRVATPGRLIIWHPFKPTVFKLVSRRTRLEKPVSARALNVDTFGDILSRVETWVYWHYISDYSSDVLAPIICYCFFSPALVVNATPRPIYSREISRTNCGGGRVGLGACLDEQGKFRPHHDSIRRSSRSQSLYEHMHKLHVLWGCEAWSVT